MRHFRIYLFLIVIFTISGCSKELGKEYIVEHPRIVAIKIDAPVVMPGEKIKLNALVIGEETDKIDMAEIRWRAGSITVHGKYGEGVSINIPQGEQLKSILGSDGYADFMLNGSATLSIYFEISIEGYNKLSAKRTMKIVNSSEQKKSNPLIQSVTAIAGSEEITVEDGVLSFDAPLPQKISLSLQLQKEDDVKELFYNWYVSPIEGVSTGNITINGLTKKSGAEITSLKRGVYQVAIVVTTGNVSNYGTDVSFGCDFKTFIFALDTDMNTETDSDTVFDDDFLVDIDTAEDGDIILFDDANNPIDEILIDDDVLENSDIINDEDEIDDLETTDVM